MCCCNNQKPSCQKPKNLTRKPEDCSPEQFRNCHGDTADHPCAPGQTKRPHASGTNQARKHPGADKT